MNPNDCGEPLVMVDICVIVTKCSDHYKMVCHLSSDFVYDEIPVKPVTFPSTSAVLCIYS